MGKNISRWLGWGAVAGMVLLLAVGTAHGKQTTAEKLSGLLVEISSLEECYESGDWAKATACLERLNQRYVAIYAEAKGQIPAGLNRRIGVCLKALGSFLNSESHQKSEQMFIAMQVALFDIMGRFEYDVHPLLGTIQRYITTEAQNSFEAGDLGHVRSELREVVALFGNNLDLFRDQGVREGQLQEFMVSLGVAVKHCRTEESESLRVELVRLSRLVNEFNLKFQARKSVAVL